MSTDGWLSDAVEKICVCDVGIVVLRLIIFVATPPIVSIPSDSGVTSRSRTSLTSPPRTPAWIAAPTATTSSGLTPLCGSLPLNIFVTASTTDGMRVMPPTRMISSMSPGFMLASVRACLTGGSVRLMRSATRSSSLARVSVMTRCFGPEASALMNGRLISVLVVLDSSIFAFSAASLSRWRAIRSFARSMPSAFLNSSASQSMIRWSKSSPPRWVSPFVDRTSKTPSVSSRLLMSNVPPPRS